MRIFINGDMGQEELLHSHTRNKRYTTRIPFRDSRWLWMSERVGEWVKNARMDVTGGIWCHWKFTPILGGSSFFPTNDALLVIVVTTNIATTTYTTLNFTHSNPVRFLWDTIAAVDGGSGSSRRTIRGNIFYTPTRMTFRATSRALCFL